jgi:myo-inositol-1(or 4)-monophosphatase
MEPFVNVAVQAARLAGDFIRRQQDQAPFLEVIQNDNHGESTVVDVQAESLIIQAIRKKFPKHNILSEEQGSIHQDSDVTWIIDPLDGTRNFIHGIGHFAVTIAVEVKNQIEHAVILDPIRHECFTASRGRGAQINNRRIRVSNKAQLNRSLIAYGKHNQLDKRPQHIQDFIHAGLNHPSLRRMGSASLDLAYVASGRLDAYFGLDLKPWDCAAGMLLIQEAGGVITNFLGKPHQKSDPDLLTGHFKMVKQMVESWNTGY